MSGDVYSRVEADEENNGIECRGSDAFRVSLQRAYIERTGGGEETKGYFDKTENWVSSATMVLILIYTVVSCQQKDIGNNQLLEMRSSSGQTDKLIKKTGEQAKAAGDLARYFGQQLEDFESVQRAFLALRGVEFGGTRYSDGPKAEFTPRIVNDGNTPVFDATAISDCTIENGGWRFKNPVYSVNIPPRDTVTLSNCQLSEDQGNAVFQGKKTLLIYGLVRFKDIFERRHLFEFCRQQILENRTTTVGAPPKPIAKSVACFGVMATHDCTDKQCADYKTAIHDTPPQKDNSP